MLAGILKLFGVLVVVAPISVFVTLMLGPLWDWVEATYGIESVGHAMYAGWCFAVTYGVLAVPSLALVLLMKGTPRAG